MFDYVISFGCSLAHGHELANRNRRYAQLIANKYNAKLIDYSVSANSNENISQTMINVLLNKKASISLSNTLVLVNWSYSTRLNYCGRNNNYYVIGEYNLNPDRRKTKLVMGHRNVYFNDDFDDPMDVKRYYEHHTNLGFLMYNMAKHIHHAQLFLKNNNLKYIFTFASDLDKKLIMDASKSYDLLEVENPYTNTSFPNFGYLMNDIDRSHICDTAFIDFVELNKFKVGFEFHPLEDGHFAYANVLIDFIESKYGQQVLHGPESGIS